MICEISKVFKENVSFPQIALSCKPLSVLYPM